jgi:glutamate-ammonia-ligase adenylyltransferase
MPVLLGRLQQRELDRTTQNRIFDLVLAICRRSAYLVLLVQHAAALDRLIEMFARSESLAERVIRFPALLDELIDPSLGHQIPEVSDLLPNVQRLLAGAPETEAALEGLNYLKLANTLRIAVAQLEGNIDGPRVQRALTALASALLQGTLELAERELVVRHGRIDSRPAGAQHRAGNSLAVIAYGSLGSGEAGYESDLDLVFLFDANDPHSNGERSLSPDRYYARLAQRMLGFLTAMTPSGRLYEVDTRLRPNGRAGSLVSSLAAFRDYQLHQAWTWELQALTRACPIAGDAQTGEVFQNIRREVLAGDRDAATVAAELSGMRQRIAAEKGRGLDAATLAKHGPGGLVDIGFTAQLGVLCEAARHPAVMHSSATANQLQALREAGWLPAADAQTLLHTAATLHQIRLLAALVTDLPEPVDTTASAAICAERLHLPPPNTVK